VEAAELVAVAVPAVERAVAAVGEAAVVVGAVVLAEVDRVAEVKAAADRAVVLLVARRVVLPAVADVTVVETEDAVVAMEGGAPSGRASWSRTSLP